MSESDPKKIGRPTKYDPDYPKQAFNLCKLGAINEDLAEAFGVHVDSIYEWQKNHEEFSEAIKKGKRIYDRQVENALFARATGYSHQEEKVFCSNGEIVTCATTKHYPPDTTAAIFWLKNRTNHWKDVNRSEISGPDGGPIQTQGMVNRPAPQSKEEWIASINAEGKGVQNDE